MSWAAVAGYYVQLYREVVNAAEWRGSELPPREFHLSAR